MQVKGNVLFVKNILRRLLIPLLAVASLHAAALAAPEPETVAAVVNPDPLGRETPRSAVSGLLEALGQKDFDRAADYLDQPAAGAGRQRVAGPEQARRLLVLLDSGGSLKPFASLSNDATGRIDDDLAIDREDVGEITVKGEKVPVLLARGPDDGQQVWRVSRETVAQLVKATDQVPADAAKESGISVAGAPLMDWLLLMGLAVVTFGGLWLLCTIVLGAMRRLVADPAASSSFRFGQASLPPLSLLIAVGVFYSWAGQLPVSIVARQALLRYTGVVAVVGVVWFGLRLIDAIADLAIARTHGRQRQQVISVITLLRRTVKVLLIAVSCVAVLDTFGIDVTAGIAALGIGGIALALGAQKTVENLVGSVTVIADRPLQIGDFVKAGDIVGTVEDVGIRSTRIRTGERTLVTIPNGDLSARQIENFAARDRFLFNPVIAVEYTASSVKLREAIGIVQQVLATHAHIAEGSRARLARIGERSFDIEVFSYIDVRDFGESVVIREELLLAIYERFEAASIGLAFPLQTILQPDSRRGVSLAKAPEAETA